MQHELNGKIQPGFDNNKTFVFHRPTDYTQRFLKARLLFLLLPTTVILIILPIVLKTPILFAVALVTIPLLALIIFVTYRIVASTSLTLSSYGLIYHEATYDYTCSWNNLEILREVRVGFSKVNGVQLRERADMSTAGWYETMENIGNVLAVLSGSSSPAKGSAATKDGKFIPIGLFVSKDSGYQGEIWQRIGQQAPWLFDETAAV